MDLQPRAFVFEATKELYTLQFYIIASITVLYYDYIITFYDELRLVWRRRMSLSSVVFLLNRYVVIFGYIPIVYFSFDPPMDITTLVALILSLRMYALYEKRLSLIIFVALLALTNVASSAYALTQFTGILLNFGTLFEDGTVFRSCVPDITSNVLPFRLSILMSFIFDSVVFILTLARTYQGFRKSGEKFSVLHLIGRDGSLYYGIMVLVNAINYFLFAVHLESLESNFFATSTGNNSMMSHIISAVMLSRLILNLHSYGMDRNSREEQTRLTTFSGRRESEFRGETRFTTHVSRLSIGSETFGHPAESMGRGTPSIYSSYIIDSGDDDVTESTVDEDFLELGSLNDHSDSESSASSKKHKSASYSVWWGGSEQ